MKKTLISACMAAGLAAPAFGGALSDPVIEEPIIVEDVSGSSVGARAQVLLLALLLSLSHAN